MSLAESQESAGGSGKYKFLLSQTCAAASYCSQPGEWPSSKCRKSLRIDPFMGLGHPLVVDPLPPNGVISVKRDSAEEGVLEVAEAKWG